MLIEVGPDRVFKRLPLVMIGIYLLLVNHTVWRPLLGRLQHYDAWPGLSFLQPRSHRMVPPIGNSCRCVWSNLARGDLTVDVV
jgi:hypothetical protein